MQYPSKKQSWLDFIHQTVNNRIKAEALDRSINRIPSTQMNHNYHHHHHPMIRPNLHHSPVQTSIFERSNYTQQQDDLENRK
jgi:hypothetical protein